MWWDRDGIQAHTHAKSRSYCIQYTWHDKHSSPVCDRENNFKRNKFFVCFVFGQNRLVNEATHTQNLFVRECAVHADSELNECAFSITKTVSSRLWDRDRERETHRETKEKKKMCSLIPSVKSPISTHILDTTRGQPAAGVDVSQLTHFIKIYIKLQLQTNSIACRRNRFRCSNWWTVTGCWYTRPLQMLTDVVPNSYNATHSAAGDTNCISMWKNTSKHSERPPSIHLSKWVHIIFCLVYHWVCTYFYLFYPPLRSHSIVLKRTVTTTYHCCSIPMDIQRIADHNATSVCRRLMDVDENDVVGGPIKLNDLFFETNQRRRNKQWKFIFWKYFGVEFIFLSSCRLEQWQYNICVYLIIEITRHSHNPWLMSRQSTFIWIYFAINYLRITIQKKTTKKQIKTTLALLYYKNKYIESIHGVSLFRRLFKARRANTLASALIHPFAHCSYHFRLISSQYGPVYVSRSHIPIRKLSPNSRRGISCSEHFQNSIPARCTLYSHSPYTSSRLRLIPFDFCRTHVHACVCVAVKCHSLVTDVCWPNRAKHLTNECHNYRSSSAYIVGVLIDTKWNAASVDFESSGEYVRILAFGAHTHRFSKVHTHNVCARKYRANKG